MLRLVAVAEHGVTDFGVYGAGWLEIAAHEANSLCAPHLVRCHGGRSDERSERGDRAAVRVLSHAPQSEVRAEGAILGGIAERRNMGLHGIPQGIQRAAASLYCF